MPQMQEQDEISEQRYLLGWKEKEVRVLRVFY